MQARERVYIDYLDYDKVAFKIILSDGTADTFCCDMLHDVDASLIHVEDMFNNYFDYGRYEMDVDKGVIYKR